MAHMGKYYWHTVCHLHVYMPPLPKHFSGMRWWKWHWQVGPSLHPTPVGYLAVAAMLHPPNTGITHTPLCQPPVHLSLLCDNKTTIDMNDTGIHPARRSERMLLLIKMQACLPLNGAETLCGLGYTGYWNIPGKLNSGLPFLSLLMC